MPEDPAGMPPCPGRRAALGLGVGAMAVVTLAACGIRLEDDAPHVPLIPTRKPFAGEAFLFGLWRECGTLAEAAAALRGAPRALPSVLAGLHREQSRVLREELRRLAVPDEVLDQPSPATPGGSPSAGTSGAPATTSAPTGTPTGGTPTAGPQSLAALETAALGGTVAWPDPVWESPSLAASFLESTRAATYGFQVVAAQSPAGAQRTLSAATLDALRTRALSQESLAGDAAGPPPLAYPLPFTVTTPATARRLAVHLLTELRSALARQLGSTGASDGPLGSLVQWLAETEVLASRWGVALQPFPGLVAPTR